MKRMKRQAETRSTTLIHCGPFQNDANAVLRKTAAC